MDESRLNAVETFKIELHGTTLGHDLPYCWQKIIYYLKCIKRNKNVCDKLNIISFFSYCVQNTSIFIKQANLNVYCLELCYNYKNSLYVIPY